MKKKIACSITILLFICNHLDAQITDVRIKGRVFTTNERFANKEKSNIKSYTRYLNDFKVILIQIIDVSKIGEIEKNKSRICANESSLLKKYRAKVYYTDKEGNYEFKGLQKKANYLLIFCDRKIQISQVQTGNSNIVYGINDKAVNL